VTGNTHRTEFCMTNSTPGLGHRRLAAGIAGFEMRDARMSLRSNAGADPDRLVLEEPYTSRHRLGTQLTNRFMLPHFTKRDFHDVLTT